MSLLKNLKPVGFIPEDVEDGPSGPAPVRASSEKEIGDSPRPQAVATAESGPQAAARPTPGDPAPQEAPTRPAIDAQSQEREMKMLVATERAMTRKGVQFDALDGVKRQDPYAVRTWLQEHVHQIPFGSDPDDRWQRGPNTLRRTAATPLQDALAAVTQQRHVQDRRASRQARYANDPLLPYLERRVIAGGECTYVFPSNSKVAFTEKADQLTFADDGIDHQAIQCGIERAIERGWNSIKLTGSPQFMSAVFIEASRAGIVVEDYEPTPADMQRLSVLEIEPPSPAKPATGLNQIAPGGPSAPPRSLKGKIPYIG